MTLSNERPGLHTVKLRYKHMVRRPTSRPLIVYSYIEV